MRIRRSVTSYGFVTGYSLRPSFVLSGQRGAKSVLAITLLTVLFVGYVLYRGLLALDPPEVQRTVNICKRYSFLVNGTTHTLSCNFRVHMYPGATIRVSSWAAGDTYISAEAIPFTIQHALIADFEDLRKSSGYSWIKIQLIQRNGNVFIVSSEINLHHWSEQ